MQKTTLSDGFVSLRAEEGYKLRKVNYTDPHSDIRQTTIPVEEAVLWEEVAVEDMPPYTKAQYDEKVAQLVRARYSESEEFAIQRKMLNVMLNPEPMLLDTDADGTEATTTSDKAVEEYNAYNAYVEQCKADAPQAIAEDIARQQEDLALRLEQQEMERLREAEETAEESEKTTTEETQD